MADYLGDDYELGKRTADAGYLVALARCVVKHYLPDYSFDGYLQHQLRWSRSMRDSRPKGYTGLVLTFGLAWAVLGVIVGATGDLDLVFAWLCAALRCAVAFTVGVGILEDRQVLKNSWLIPPARPDCRRNLGDELGGTPRRMERASVHARKREATPVNRRVSANA